MRIERSLIALIGLAAGVSLGGAALAQSATSGGPTLSVPGAASAGPAYGPAPAAASAEADGRAADDGASNSRRGGPRARRRIDISPYLEVDAGVTADFNRDDTVTYTSVAAGVDGRIETRRVTAAASYRYERRIEVQGNLPDSDIHSGVAQVAVQVVPGAVQIDAGALATRTGGNGRAVGVSNVAPSVGVYSGYVGPSVATRVGDVAVNASYRLGYVAIDDNTVGSTANRTGYDEAVAHHASASVGMAPGRLPVGWTVGAGYARDDAGALDESFEAEYVRGDVVVPVTPSVALTGGVGYERIRSSQSDVVRDPATGAPVVGANGRLTADPAAPRLLNYDMDGVIADGGVIWRPSHRTELQARAGWRYDDWTFLGTLQHRFNGELGLSAAVYDTVETFGSRLTSDISSLPTDFEINPNALTGDLGLGGCVFGSTPGSGVCFDRALQSVNGGTFRSRGASLLLSGARGRWDFGTGLSYSNRRYFRPNVPGATVFGPGSDDGVSLFGQVNRRLSRTSSLGFDVFASRYSDDLPGTDPVFGAGFTTAYRRSFLLDHLQFQAALGVFHSDDGVDTSTVGTGLIGLRYSFDRRGGFGD